MPPPSPSRLLEVEKIGEVTVVKITTTKILEEKTTELIGRQLFTLAKEVYPPKLVLNFAKVERLTSVMLGKLVALHKKMEADGGRLALCHVSGQLYEIFDLLKLPKVLHIYDQEQQALQAF